MPKLACGCGAVIRMSETEFENSRGESVRCRSCGKSLRLPELEAEVIRVETKPAVRRKSLQSYTGAAVALVLCVVVAGLLFWTAQSRNKSGDPIKLGFLPDPELRAVRAWLEENLDSGQWEEVRWWTMRPQQALHQAEIKSVNVHLNAAITKRVADLCKDALAKLERDGPSHAARLKFRTANKVGAIVLRDEMFRVEDGRAIISTPSRDDIIGTRNWKKDFPE